MAAVNTCTGLRKYNETEKSTAPTVVTSQQLASGLRREQIDPLIPYVHQMQTSDQEKIIPEESNRFHHLKTAHGFAHLGANAMVTALHLKGITWPKLKEECLQYIRQCTACQHYNIAQKGYHPLQAVHATLPGEHIAIDLAQFPKSEKKNEFVLVVVDVCTRFVFLRAMQTRDATTVAGLLYTLFSDIGFPKIIQSDNGPEFRNELVATVTKMVMIKHRFSTPYHPRGNGVVERSVRSVKDLLPKLLDGKIQHWDDYLPMVQLQLNTKVTSFHNSTPFSLFYGRAFAGLQDFSAAESRLLEPKDLDERLDYLTKLVFPAISDKSTVTQKQMIQKFNRSHHLTEFPVGSHVMIKDEEATSTLDAPYAGPFRVVHRTTWGTYVLRDAMNQLLARNYAPEQLKLAFRADHDHKAPQSYRVESIVSHRDFEGERLYMVKWAGYDETENSEIPYENFDSKSLVTRYYKKLNQVNPHAPATRSKHGA